MLYDLFICYASEDKKSFVLPLAKALRDEHVEVWFDDFSLKLGDSIRRSIDEGLTQSRFGIVVLSPAFFEKNWPQYELDGLTEIEMKGRDKVLLPIWHGVGHNEVFSYSPALANRKAIPSTKGLRKVVKEILKVVRPDESPLVDARNFLLGCGVVPPVITDSYWLDVVEASNRIEGFGPVIPEESTWDRWAFPLPDKYGDKHQWGLRLAWTALQLKWTKSADEQGITILTSPEKVLAFIRSQTGLHQICKMYPNLLKEYAPQLTIPSFGAEFEDLFKEVSKEAFNRLHPKGVKIKENHFCTEEWALMEPDFGGYDSVTLAEAYFSGGMFGPEVSPYEHTDHLVWLLLKSKFLAST